MKTKNLYCGRIELFRELGCTVSASGTIERMEKNYKGELMILLLDVFVRGSYVDHLWIKAKTNKLPGERLYFTGTVAMYARNTKVGIRNILLSDE